MTTKCWKGRTPLLEIARAQLASKAGELHEKFVTERTVSDSVGTGGVQTANVEIERPNVLEGRMPTVIATPQQTENRNQSSPSFETSGVEHVTAVLAAGRTLDEESRRRVGLRLMTPLADEFHRAVFGDPERAGSLEEVNSWWQDLKAREKTRAERGEPSRQGRDIAQLLDDEKVRSADAIRYFRDYFNAMIIFDGAGDGNGKPCVLVVADQGNGTLKFKVGPTAGGVPYWNNVQLPSLKLARE